MFKVGFKFHWIWLVHVGKCVPFYFCPRSIMLYILHMGNHPEISFTGWQNNIIHLEADLNSTIDLANNANRKWVFTDRNAGSSYFRGVRI